MVKAYDLIQKLEDNHWKTIKSEEIKKIIAACAGLFMESVADVQEVSTGSRTKVKQEVINRSSVKMNWISSNDNSKKLELSFNKVVNDNIEVEIQNVDPFTNPYYLNEKGTEGMYVVNDQRLSLIHI